AQTNELVVRSFAQEIGRFDAALVSSVVMEGGAGRDVLAVDPQVDTPAVLHGEAGADILKGGAGLTTLDGGSEDDKLRTGPGATPFVGDGGKTLLFSIKPIDTVTPGPMDRFCAALPVVAPPPAATSVLDTSEVEALLRRAAAASASDDAII